MSSAINSTSLNQAVRAVPKNNPTLFAGAAILLGVTGAAMSTKAFRSSNEASSSSVESQFGTSDGYFPSATRGSVLSNPPGNKNHLVGEHYVPLVERRTYATKRKTMLKEKKKTDAF